METGVAVTGQEIGPGFHTPVNPDGYVTIDVESFSHVIHKDFSSSSPIVTRSVSRKESLRSNNERKLHSNANGNDKETSSPQSPVRGSCTPEKASTVRPIDHVGTDTTAATIVSASPLHQITVTTTSATGRNMISEQNRERRFGFARKSSFKRSRTSWMLDPKKILIFFATFIAKTIERYQKRVKETGINHTRENNSQQARDETYGLTKKIEQLEISKRKLLGKGIDACSIEELQQLENQLERGLSRIRAKKYQLLREEIEKLKEEERNLIKENKELKEKWRGMGAIVVASPSSTLSSAEVNTDSVDNMEVETGLFIGPPEPRQSKKLPL